MDYLMLQPSDKNVEHHGFMVEEKKRKRERGTGVLDRSALSGVRAAISQQESNGPSVNKKTRNQTGCRRPLPVYINYFLNFYYL